MSKSLNRVRTALEAAGVTPHIRETELARTAVDAARAVGCTVDQIAKSIIFAGQDSGVPILFLTAGGNRVDPERAADLAKQTLIKADAALVRRHTGFAIGGVAPIGHLNPIHAFLDRRLLAFQTVWAAAGTPHHVFEIAPGRLQQISRAIVGDFATPAS